MPTQKNPPPVRFAFIGGSGIYELEGLKTLRSFYPRTPFGKPSDPITIGELNGISCAFLPRHGKGHRYLPGEIPQQANFYALKMLGVEFVVALSACGSLKEELAPRTFVIPDQLIDRTKGRPATFFGDGIVAHVSFAHPFSRSLTNALVESAQQVGVKFHEGGTYMCMEGPAFSTRAESLLHKSLGCDVIGMTALPEAKLAREAEMAYALLAMVTDYDCWKEENEVTADLVLQNLKANAANAQKILLNLLPRLGQLNNDAGAALKGALFTAPLAMKPATQKKLWPLIRKYVQ